MSISHAVSAVYGHSRDWFPYFFICFRLMLSEIALIVVSFAAFVYVALPFILDMAPCDKFKFAHSVFTWVFGTLVTFSIFRPVVVGFQCNSCLPSVGIQLFSRCLYFVSFRVVFFEDALGLLAWYC